MPSAMTLAFMKLLFAVDNEAGEEEFVEVPTEDYRSIRRAILDLNEFERDYSRRAVPDTGST